MSAHAKAARPGPVEGMKKQQSWKTYKRERNEAREKLEREEAAAAEAAAHQPADSILDVVMLAQSSMARRDSITGRRPSISGRRRSMRGEHGRRGSLKGEDPKVIYSQKLDEVVDLFGESKGFRQKEREAEDPMRAAMSKFSGQADKVVKGIHLYTLGARRMRKGLLKPTKREEYEDDFIREADDLDIDGGTHWGGDGPRLVPDSSVVPVHVADLESPASSMGGSFRSGMGGSFHENRGMLQPGARSFGMFGKRDTVDAARHKFLALIKHRKGKVGDGKRGGGMGWAGEASAGKTTIMAVGEGDEETRTGGAGAASGKSERRDEGDEGGSGTRGRKANVKKAAKKLKAVKKSTKGEGQGGQKGKKTGMAGADVKRGEEVQLDGLDRQLSDESLGSGKNKSPSSSRSPVRMTLRSGDSAASAGSRAKRNKAASSSSPPRAKQQGSVLAGWESFESDDEQAGMGGESMSISRTSSGDSNAGKRIVHQKPIESHKIPEYERGATLMERYSTNLSSMRQKLGSKRANVPPPDARLSDDNEEYEAGSEADNGPMSMSLPFGSVSRSPEGSMLTGGGRGARGRLMNHPVPKLLYDEAWFNQLAEPGELLHGLAHLIPSVMYMGHRALSQFAYAVALARSSNYPYVLCCASRSIRRLRFVCVHGDQEWELLDAPVSHMSARKSEDDDNVMKLSLGGQEETTCLMLRETWKMVLMAMAATQDSGEVEEDDVVWEGNGWLVRTGGQDASFDGDDDAGVVLVHADVMWPAMEMAAPLVSKDAVPLGALSRVESWPSHSSPAPTLNPVHDLSRATEANRIISGLFSSYATEAREKIKMERRGRLDMNALLMASRRPPPQDMGSVDVTGVQCHLPLSQRHASRASPPRSPPASPVTSQIQRDGHACASPGRTQGTGVANLAVVGGIPSKLGIGGEMRSGSPRLSLKDLGLRYESELAPAAASPRKPAATKRSTTHRGGAANSPRVLYTRMAVESEEFNMRGRPVGSEGTKPVGVEGVLLKKRGAWVSRLVAPPPVQAYGRATSLRSPSDIKAASPAQVGGHGGNTHGMQEHPSPPVVPKESNFRASPRKSAMTGGATMGSPRPGGSSPVKTSPNSRAVDAALLVGSARHSPLIKPSVEQWLKDANGATRIVEVWDNSMAGAHPWQAAHASNSGSGTEQSVSVTPRFLPIVLM